MAGLIIYSTSSRGKPVVIDKYHHRYTLNNFSTTQNYWRCANRSCSARLNTRIPTKDLCSSDLPEHNHGNQHLKEMAQKHEQEIIKLYYSEGSSPGNLSKHHGLWNHRTHEQCFICWTY